MMYKVEMVRFSYENFDYLLPIITPQLFYIYLSSAATQQATLPRDSVSSHAKNKTINCIIFFFYLHENWVKQIMKLWGLKLTCNFLLGLCICIVLVSTFSTV